MALQMQLASAGLFGLVFLLAGGALSSLLLVLGLKFLEGKNQLRFYNLMARQISGFAFVLALGVFLVFLAAAIALFTGMDGPIAAMPALNPEASKPGALFGGLIIMLVFALASFWNMFVCKRSEASSQAQASSSGAALIAGVTACVFGLGLFLKLAPELLPGFPRELYSWLSAYTGGRADLVMICSYIHMLMLLLSLTLCLCLCLLLLRRNRDDYGRDYYNFALSQLSTWNVFLCSYALVSGLAVSFFMYQAGVANYAPVAVAAAYCIMITLAGFIYFQIKNSQNPLRHKPGIAAGALLMLASLFMALFITLNFYYNLRI